MYVDDRRKSYWCIHGEMWQANVMLTAKTGRRRLQGICLNAIIVPKYLICITRTKVENNKLPKTDVNWAEEQW